MTTPTILIIGATGHLGKETLIALIKDSRSASYKLKAGVKFTSLSASQTRDSMLDSFGVESVTCDLDHPQTVESACRGASMVFLILPNTPTKVDQCKTMIDSLKGSNIDRFIFLSSMGCEKMSNSFLAQFRECEKLIEQSGLNYTIIRSALFQEALLVFGDEIAVGRLDISMESGKIAPISLADVGEIVANILFEEDAHRFAKKIFNLTGPELLSGDDIAQILSKIVGKPVEYHSQTPEEMKQHYVQLGHSQSESSELTQLFESIARSESASVSKDSEQILGREPVNLEKTLHDHKDRLVTIRMIDPQSK